MDHEFYVFESTIDSHETSTYPNASKWTGRRVFVSASVTVLRNIELDRWNADIYGVMSLASRLSSLVKDRAATVKVAYHIRRLDSSLAKLFTEIRKAIEEGTPKGHGVTLEHIVEISESLGKLHEILDKFHEACRRSRLTNNSLVAGSIKSINNYKDEVLELSELLDLSRQPEVVKSIYNRAKAEKERGELFDLSEV
jgi:hypothetical protein